MKRLISLAFTLVLVTGTGWTQEPKKERTNTSTLRPQKGKLDKTKCPIFHVDYPGNLTLRIEPLSGPGFANKNFSIIVGIRNSILLPEGKYEVRIGDTTLLTSFGAKSATGGRTITYAEQAERKIESLALEVDARAGSHYFFFVPAGSTVPRPSDVPVGKSAVLYGVLKACMAVANGDRNPPYPEEQMLCVEVDRGKWSDAAGGTVTPVERAVSQAEIPIYPVNEDFHYVQAMGPGGRLYLENFNGTVEIAGWDKDEVEVNGTKYASTRETLNALRVDVTPSPEGVRIRSVGPSGRTEGMGVRYVLRVPRKVELDRVINTNGGIRVEDVEGPGRLHTSNGSVRAARYRGSLEIGTSNGAIELREFNGAAVLKTSNGSIEADAVRGAFEATATSGSISARLIEIDDGHRIRAQTTNGRIDLTVEKLRDNDIQASATGGSITLRLPAPLNARLNASTTNSSVSSDFDVSARTGRLSRNHIEGTVGSGGPLIDLTTTKGSIRILKF